MQQTAKYIIIAGLIIITLGILLYFSSDKLKWLGHLPGDIMIEKGNFKIYFPVVTMLLISIVVCIVTKLIQMFK